MSIFRFTDGAIRFPNGAEWAGEEVPGTSGGAGCFHCGLPFGEGEPVVCWMGMTAEIAWHKRCAEGWLLAFARDVWAVQREEAWTR